MEDSFRCVDNCADRNLLGASTNALPVLPGATIEREVVVTNAGAVGDPAICSLRFSDTLTGPIDPCPDPFCELQVINGAGEIVTDIINGNVGGGAGNLPGTLDLAPGGIAGETAQVLENIQALLASHGATMSDVVKCTVMLADIADWPQFNAVYKSYFTAPYPARSAFATTGLALGAAVEVECLARR